MSDKIKVIRDVTVFLLVGSVLWWYFGLTVNGYDFVVHAGEAMRIKELGEVRSPHFVYELCLLALNSLFGLSYREASQVVMVGARLLTLAGVYWFLARAFGRSAWALFVSVALVFANPIMLLYGLDEKFYSGYIYMNVYHNPTVELLRPFALFIFIAMSDSMDEDHGSCQLVWISVLTVVSCFVKPNFALCAVPVAAFVWFFQFVRRGRSNRVLGVFWVLSSVCLVLQFGLYMGARTQGGVSIAFMPFEVLSSISDYLLLKFLCSLVFILVLAVAFPSVLKDRSFSLAFWIFLVSCLWFSLFGETGSETETLSGNFLWGGMVALFLLFVSAGRFLVLNIVEAGVSISRVFLPLAALVVHVGAGVVWMVYGCSYNF